MSVLALVAFLVLSVAILITRHSWQVKRDDVIASTNGADAFVWDVELVNPYWHPVSVTFESLPAGISLTCLGASTDNQSAQCAVQRWQNRGRDLWRVTARVPPHGRAGVTIRLSTIEPVGDRMWEVLPLPSWLRLGARYGIGLTGQR